MRFDSLRIHNRPTTEQQYTLGYQKAKNTGFRKQKFENTIFFIHSFLKSLRSKELSNFDQNHDGIFCFEMKLEFKIDLEFLNFITQYRKSLGQDRKLQ